MIARLVRRYRTELFSPTWLSVVVNPFYFIRAGLLRAMKENAVHMRGRMLDFGCGTQPYRALFDVDEYVGLDVESSGAAESTRPAVVLYDGRTIPFADAWFDAVLSSEVLDDIADVGGALDELNRVMKPGAALLVTVPFIWDDPCGSRDIARYTSHGVTQLLETRGFVVASVRKTTTSIETIAQLWIAYLVQSVFPVNRLARAALTLLVVFPMNVLGRVVSGILPNDGRLYHNTVVLARKAAA